MSVNLSRKEVRFSRDYGSNPTANIFDLKTLKYYSFSSNEKGNLYTLIMNKKNVSFPSSLEYVAKILGLNRAELNQEIILPFGGFYKELLRSQTEPELSIKTYSTSILDGYKDKYNLQFLKDGISFDTQAKFDVGIDFDSMRITVPQWTVDGKLAGIMGRSLDKNCPHEDRWLPIIPCQRSYTLFGYHQNYKKIQEKNTCIIFESEKAVMQLDSFGSNVALATCGCHISNTQAKYIRSLMTKTIILAYDEGLEEEAVRAEAEKLKIDNKLIINKVGYVYDEDGLYIPKGSKKNAADMGKKIFTKIIKEKVRWI